MGGVSPRCGIEQIRADGIGLLGPFPKWTIPSSKEEIRSSTIWLAHDILNHTVQGVILPVCVPRLDPFLVLSNYTTPQYAKYLKDSNYTGTGIGFEDNWMVVVLCTNTSAGNFSGVASLIANFSLGNSLVALFIGILVVSAVS
ncbi:hypothetical protein SO802_013462 [Lithocarpus litseifolius]|uniref:Uncharacterized GPI-anchored protein At5g19230-like domain-containing protein n=1 Tax=Lithocarpus litseifolius TaxID=425828 RepID=A0AAW2DB60_9ROSI